MSKRECVGGWVRGRELSYHLSEWTRGYANVRLSLSLSLHMSLSLSLSLCVCVCVCVCV